MSYAYEFSSSFDALKNTKEQLSDNYTTRDYVSSLDTLIYNALRPLVHSSKFSDTFISGITAWYSSNAKRRISRLEKSEFFGLVAHMLATDDVEVKMIKLQQMQLERTILFYLIDTWLLSLNGYTRTVAVYAKTKDKEKRAQIDQFEYTVGKRKGSIVSLYSAVRECKFWMTQYLQLKEMILEKYTRIIISWAQKDYKTLGHKVNLSDLVQNYMMMASKALDKCDYKQGTLTSYIQLWLKDARKKSQKNESIDSGADEHMLHLDSQDEGSANTVEMSTDDSNSDNDHIHNIRSLIKLIDPLGIFRLMTGIEEKLSKQEIKLLMKG